MSKSRPSPPPNRRLSPDKRREHLLDQAAELIVARGLSVCSLEELAAKAGVSKALVYKYFADRDELLKALVSREYEILTEQEEWSDPDLSMGISLKRANRVAFQHLRDRAKILREILSDGPTSRALGRSDRDERERRTRFFSEKVQRTYGVSPKVAFLGSLITGNVPGVASGALERGGFTPQESADFWTTFVLGGWAAVSARFGDRECLIDGEQQDKANK